MAFERQRSGLGNLFDELEDLVSSGFEMVGRQFGRMYPHIDIVEEDDSYRLLADIPGMSRDEISVRAEQGKLTISGEKKRALQPGKDRYYHFERGYGPFSRDFKLPEDVDLGRIDARYGNGVLELVLYKRKDARSKPVDIKID